MFKKSVIVFVSSPLGTFVESAECGPFSTYKTANQFIQSLKKLYKDHGEGKYAITDVVIG